MIRAIAPRGGVLAAFVAGLLIGRPAVAQAPAPNPWRTQLEFGLNGASGNSSFSVLRTGVSIKRTETKAYELEASALVRRGSNQSKTIADDGKISLKFDYKPEETFSPFVYGLWGYDHIRKLAQKVNGGAGAKYTFFKTEKDKSKASVSWAAIWDFEGYTSDQPSEGLVRWSGRLKFDHDFGGGAAFEHTFFYQPQVDQMGDYLIDASTSVTSKLLNNVSLAVNHEYLHDSVPPEGIKPDDQKFSVVLRVSL